MNCGILCFGDGYCNEPKLETSLYVCVFVLDMLSVLFLPMNVLHDVYSDDDFFFLYGSGMDILILLLLSYNSITKSKNCLLFHEANIKPLHSRSGQRANSIAATHNTLNGLGWPFAANAINFGNKKQNEHNNNNSRDDEWEMEMKQEWKTNQNLLTDNLKANWNVRCSVKYSPLLTMSCSAQFPICLWIWFFFCSCSD